jgi:hypothetical protein
MCACIPTTRPLFARIIPSFGTIYSRSSNAAPSATISSSPSAGNKRSKSSLLNWKFSQWSQQSERSQASHSQSATGTEDLEKQIQVGNMGWPLPVAPVLSNDKAARVLGDDRILRSSMSNRTKMVIMQQTDVAVTRTLPSLVAKRELQDFDEFHYP